MLLLCDASDTFRHVQFAHASCSESKVHHLDYEMSREEAAEIISAEHGMSFTVAVRSQPAPRAVLMCEPHTSAGGDANLQPYKDAGFGPTEIGFAKFVGDPIRSFKLRLTANSVVLEGPGARSELELGDVTPPQWIDALRGDLAVVVIIGNRLGLDRLVAERVDAQLALGDAIAAVVPVTASPTKRPARKPSRRRGRR